MLPKKFRHNPGRVRAVLYAVLVHAAVIALVVIGFRWTVQDFSTEKVVQAVVAPEPTDREAEEEKKRALEEEARRKAGAEKRHQEELRRKREAEQKRLAEERRKKEAEEKEKQKRAAEVERKKEEKRRQKLAEESLKEQLAVEEKQRSEAARAARAASEVDRYKALIRRQVTRNWSRPVGAAKGLKCAVRVRLTPGGEVLGAEVITTSGDALFDRSVVNAVYKATPLPLPEDPALFDDFREIQFLFSPEE